MTAERKGKRIFNKPWKRILGHDRGYTRRVERAKERGQYTPPAGERRDEHRD